jgi:MarR family
MIDTLRAELQSRKQQLEDELRRVEAALRALGDTDGRASHRRGGRRTAGGGTSRQSPSGAAVGNGRGANAAGRRRVPRRAVKTQVLAALDGAEPKTAGEIATKLGINRTSASVVLSNAVKSGEARKATPRGYLAAAKKA